MRSVSGFGAVLSLLAVSPAPATPLFSENFEIDPTANWTVNNGPGTQAANFFFDYSTVGIPPAPNGAGTRGMKLQANLTGGVFSGFSVSPMGQNFTGDYTLNFDWWANFNGPFPGGGSGSTNLSTFGIGTSGTIAQWPGGTQDSVWFAATGDGGSASDYRAYSTAAPTSYPSGSPVYAAPGGGINNTNAYYAVFGGVMAPAAQLALFPQQTGTTAVGSAGMAWHQVVIDKSGNSATWRVDGLLIATIDLNTVTLGGGDIFFGHSDINATSSTDPNAPSLLFTLIDNITVVPEPGTLGLLALGGLLIVRRRR
ncbi:MAG TPA: PEP-CTERM sorting domain-containing protein [Phycisphaerae bacterium]